MRVIKLPAEKMATGNALLNSLFGPDRRAGTFVEGMQEDQRELCADDAVEVSRIYATPDEWDHVIVNRRRLEPYRGPAAYIAKQMKIGSRASLFTGPADEATTDLATVLLDIYVIVVQSSPVRPGWMRGPHARGLYRRSHEIWVNGRRASTLSAGVYDNPSDFGQILNRIDYASTLETPENRKPYQRAFKKARAKYGYDWDMRLEYAQAKAFGGNIKTSRYTSKRKDREYAIPVITVAPLNTLDQTGEFVWVKRRTAKQRSNPAAIAARIARQRNKP